MNTPGFRAPAVPLVTHDPLFSLWSFSDNLTDDVTRHWDGVRQFMFGVLVVDKQIFRFMGKVDATDERYTTDHAKLPQTGCEIRPMTTRYTFANELLDMELTFTSPLLLNDLMILSRPVTYIDYKIDFKDGKEHETHIYFGFSGEFCVNDCSQKVSVGMTPYSIYFTSGTENMLVRSGDDHRIEWGSFHAIAPGYEMQAKALRTIWSYFNVTYSSFLFPNNVLPNQGPNPETRGPKDYELFQWTPVYPDFPVILLKKEFHGESAICGGIAVAYDDVKSIQYFGENIDAYWKKDGDDFGTMVRKALDEHDQVLEKVAAFEEELLAKANTISSKYADILSLAYRQAIAGHKLTWHNGRLQFFSKENYSNGSIATVDVTYPSIPLFLMYAPELVEGMLDPVFEMVERGLWYYEFAPHDLGVYPLANGQMYGYSFRHRRARPDPYDSQMPVEECGNMILCVAAACYKKGDLSYFVKHKKILTQWADYLVKIGFDPDNQLCTDDFAGHLAHNCNLSVKAICALAIFGRMLKETGCAEEGERYAAIARDFVKSWEEKADQGDHYGLTFDQPDTWSLKYNMVWDKLFGLNLFSGQVYEKELNYYKSKVTTYGIPMDSRSDATKTDWEMWSTKLFDDAEYTNAVVDAMWKYLSECYDRFPFPDLIFTTKPWMRGFPARTVQGGLFINLLSF